MNKKVLAALVAGMMLCAGCGGAETAKENDTEAEVIEDSSAEENTAEEGEADESGEETGTAEEGTAHAGLAEDADKEADDPDRLGHATAYADLPAAYRSVLDEACAFVTTGKGYDGGLGSIGMRELVEESGVEEGLYDIVYTTMDLDGDGSEELLILGADNRILAMYSLEGDKAGEVLESSARSRYYLLEDSRIFYEGSNGAAYSIYAFYRYQAGEVTVQDYYFTEYADMNDMNSLGWYHNTTGEYDISVSERVDESIDGDQYELMSAYEAEIAQFNDVPFVDLT